MAQFLVLAYDGTDPGAAERRKAARPLHFQAIGQMVEKGELICGGALLDDAGKMIGSAVFVEFPSRKELDAWFAREPYVQQKVWQKIEVKPVRVAVANGKINQ